jgi:hypothetical protein
MFVREQCSVAKLVKKEVKSNFVEVLIGFLRVLLMLLQIRM